VTGPRPGSRAELPAKCRDAFAQAHQAEAAAVGRGGEPGAAAAVVGHRHREPGTVVFQGDGEVEVSCPTGLKAVSGTTITCTGRKNDGTIIDIPVTVISATDSRITWKFLR